MAALPAPHPPARTSRLQPGKYVPAHQTRGQPERAEWRGGEEQNFLSFFSPSCDRAPDPRQLTHLAAPDIGSAIRRATRPALATRSGRRSLPRAILRPTTRQRSILDQGRGREGGGAGAPHIGQTPPQVTARARSGPILRCPRSPTLLLATGPSWRWHRRLPEAGEQTFRQAESRRMSRDVRESPSQSVRKSAQNLRSSTELHTSSKRYLLICGSGKV
jgi:hypothetical protein